MKPHTADTMVPKLRANVEQKTLQVRWGSSTYVSCLSQLLCGVPGPEYQLSRANILVGVGGGVGD